jgi:citrate synthase
VGERIRLPTRTHSLGIGETAITGIDGARGTLTYRGYGIAEIVRRWGYESVVELLLRGTLPSADPSPAIAPELCRRRRLPADLQRVADALPAATPPIDALRTLVSALNDLAAIFPPTESECLDLIARTPLLVARQYRRARSLSPVPPDPELGHVANFLWMLSGERPEPARARALERYWVLLADHGISASTFALRVVLSTRSDLASAVTAALGALKGPLHGGAPPEVLEMLDAAKSPDRVAAYVTGALDRRERLYGFGHPTYRVEDPRAALLREFAAEVARPERFALARRFEESALAALRERRPGQALFTNVDFYGSVLLEGVGLPRELFTPVFALARTAGWSAHALEQVSQRRLVRPPEEYVGPAPRALP